MPQGLAPSGGRVQCARSVTADELKLSSPRSFGISTWTNSVGLPPLSSSGMPIILILALDIVYFELKSIIFTLQAGDSLLYTAHVAFMVQHLPLNGLHLLLIVPFAPPVKFDPVYQSSCWFAGGSCQKLSGQRQFLRVTSTWIRAGSVSSRTANICWS